MNRYSYLMKIIIIGDPSVGKSCLLMQFLQGKFKYDSETTIGVEFGSKTIAIENEKIKLQIWDTAGQQIFKSITRSYYRGSIGAVLVYDIGNRNSFKNLQKWLTETKTYSNDKLSIILIGNKCDIDQSLRQVTQEQGKKFADDNNMIFMQSSAKIYEKTQELFTKLVMEVVRKIKNKEIDPRNEALGVKIGVGGADGAVGNGNRVGRKSCCY